MGNASGEDIPARFVQDDEGEWIGKMNEGYDQHFVLTDSKGRTKKVSSDDAAEVTIEVMPEGYTGASA